MSTCRDCRHFVADGRAFERLFPGLSSLSSGYGASRADSGLCRHHDDIRHATDSCADLQRPQAAS